MGETVECENLVEPIRSNLWNTFDRRHCRGRRD